MPASETQRIFLSAVSREFRRCREMLRNDLMGPDLPCQVTEQANFAVGGESLLEKLDRYISESIAVVHLIGKATGEMALPQETAALLRRHPDFLRHYPSIRAALDDGRTVSYTQWEAYLALHHGVRLFLFLPSDSFTERPPGFTVEVEEEASQTRHCKILIQCGLDRGEFTSSERLSSQVLRSLSRLLLKSRLPFDVENARDLEAFALDREQNEPAESEERQTLIPLHLDLELPPWLVVGQSLAPAFCIKEPGRTVLEEVKVEFQIGGAKTTATCEHLTKGQSVRLLPDSDLLLQHEGTSQLQMLVTCQRSSLLEKFVWKGMVNVIRAERLEAARTDGINRDQRRVRRVRLELIEEVLSPRVGAMETALQPVPAGGAAVRDGES